jgi:3-deoxy-D-manno-octulosonic acid kinase
VAARYEQSGIAYRADLITEELPGTRTLAASLAEGEVGLTTWTAIGRCIRRFHDHGVSHADLNAHNILLRGDDEVFLVDFDRASRRRKPGLWRDANLARLRRSLDALDDARRERRCGDTEWQCLLSAWL